LEDPEKSEEVIGIEMESWVVEEFLLDLSSSNSVHERVEESLDIDQFNFNINGLILHSSKTVGQKGMLLFCSGISREVVL
jgi:hypothetical protein